MLTALPLLIIGGIIALTATLMIVAFVIIRSRKNEITTVESHPEVPHISSPEHQQGANPSLQFETTNISLPEGLDDHTKAKIASFINDNLKIEAIKLLREKTGMGLKEAKDYVEALDTDKVLLGSVMSRSPIVQGVLDDTAIAQIMALLGQKRKIDAIRLVRERTGWGLKEAKDYVDSLEQ